MLYYVAFLDAEENGITHQTNDGTCKWASMYNLGKSSIKMFMGNKKNVFMHPIKLKGLDKYRGIMEYIK